MAIDLNCLLLLALLVNFGSFNKLLKVVMLKEWVLPQHLELDHFHLLVRQFVPTVQECLSNI